MDLKLLCIIGEPLPLKDIPHYLQTTLSLMVLTLVYFKWAIILERFSTQFANDFIGYDNNSCALLVSHHLRWNCHTVCKQFYWSWYQLVCTLSEPLPLKDIPHYPQTSLLLMVLTLVYFEWAIILERFSTQFANDFIGHDNNSFALLVSRHHTVWKIFHTI